MLVFFDTEFTDLTKDARLISIGFVGEDGKHEFYAELSDTYQLSDCSNFVREAVLPHLQGGEALMTMRELAVKIIPWLLSLKEHVQLATDSLAWDWPWMEAIFAESGAFLLENTIVWEDMKDSPKRLSGVARPKNVDGKPALLHEIVNTPFLERAVNRTFRKYGLRRHHALDDAKANRLVWLALKSKSKLKPTVTDHIKSNILSSKEVVFLRRDFKFGDSHAVDSAIRSLLKQKSLLRLGRGIYIRNHSTWTRDKIVHVICKRLGNRVNRTLLYGYTKIHIGKTVTYFSAVERLDKFGLRIAQTVLEHYPIDEIRSYCLKILSDWDANGTSYVSNVEWKNIMLNGTDDEVIYVMTSEDQEPANRLRQSSPYIGMLSTEHMNKLRQELRNPHLL